MNGLQVELSGFRSEMQEFKKAVEKRMDCLDNRSTACQFNPNVCATARRLEEHIKSDNGKAGSATRIKAIHPFLNSLLKLFHFRSES